MSDLSQEHLERLITRYLDQEAMPAERAELRRVLDADPAAQALYHELSALDVEAGRALRHAMPTRVGGTAHPARRQPIAQTVGLVAAACLMAMVWIWSPTAQSPNGPVNAGPSVGPSLGAPSRWRAPTLDGSAQIQPVLLERPYSGRRHTQRNWIVVPGDRPNEIYLIEVNQVQTRAVVVHADY